MTGKQQPSHVQKAMGFSDAKAKSSLRFGFSCLTPMDEALAAAEAVKKAVEKLRRVQGGSTGPVVVYSAYHGCVGPTDLGDARLAPGEDAVAGGGNERNLLRQMNPLPGEKLRSGKVACRFVDDQHDGAMPGIEKVAGNGSVRSPLKNNIRNNIHCRPGPARLVL